MNIFFILTFLIIIIYFLTYGGEKFGMYESALESWLIHH